MKNLKTIFVLTGIAIGICGILISRKDEKIQNIVEEKMIEGPETKIVLYFINEENGDLSKEYRCVSLNDVEKDMPNTIMTELLIGPKLDGLKSKIPANTKINKITQSGDIIMIDFSEDFLENDEDEYNSLQKIYSVVNSLTEITEINEVKITVNDRFYAKKSRL